MTSTRYDVDVTGLREIGTSDAMRAAMVDAAQAALPAIKAAAPRATGALSASFKVEPTTVEAGRRRETRAGAAIVAQVPYAEHVRTKGHRRFMSTIPAIVKAATR